MSKQAVIYVRVSDSRQRDNTSLAEQERSCTEWCQRSGIAVNRVFVEEGQSAKTANRTEFQRMFGFLLEQHGRISHLVIDKFDRFARDRDDAASYRVKLRGWGIQLVSVKEPVDDTPAGNFVAGLFESMAQFDNEVRRERSMSGMKATLASGGWPWRAPLGFLNGETGGPSLIHDPKSAPLMAELFAKVAEGFELQRAIDWVTVRGLRTRLGNSLSTSTASRVLRSPLYKGRVEYPAWGISTEGNFAPIVSPAEWAKARAVLDGNAVTAVPHSRANPAYPLKGIIICDKCGRVATAATSKGRSSRYPYYRCHRENRHLNIRADKAERAFQLVLESLIPNPARLLLVEEVFRDVWNQRNTSRQSLMEGLEAQLKTLTGRKGRVLERMQDGDLQGGDFRTLYDKVNAQIAQAEAALVIAQGTELEVDVALSYLRHLLWNLRILFENSDLEAKRRLCKAIFPDGIRCSKAGFGTVVSHSLFSMLADESVGVEYLASPTGFEPVLSP